MNYRNQQAENDNVDPRQKLVDFIFGNFGNITRERRQRIIATHQLRGVDEKEQLKEFVLTKNPYQVLDECFSSTRLHILAEDKYNISLDSDFGDRELSSVILNRLGFRTEVKTYWSFSEAK